MVYNVIEDISRLTSVSQNTLDKMVQKGVYSICDSVENTMMSMEDNVTVLDIGIGTLSIMVENEEIQYKFIPSKKLESCLISTCINGKSPLVDIIDKSIKAKINIAYKDLF